MLRVKDFKRHYGDLLAVDRFSMEANSHEIVGLIGPDGAGKTTILRSIATLQNMEDGEVTIDGLDVRTDFLKIRKRLGYMPGQFSLYPDLSVWENLSFFMDIHGVRYEQCKDAIDPIFSQLAPFKSRKSGQLSGGMKQKLALCCALVNQPSLLLLDEPTTGVDPVSRREFWNILKDYRSQGTSMVVSTPYMDEAMMCDQILLIHEGKVLESGSPKALIEKPRNRSFYQIEGIPSSEIYRFKQNIMRRHPEVFAYLSGKAIRVIAKKEHSLMNILQETLSRVSGIIREVTPDIEDVFMFHLTNRNDV
ncbi:ABC transporter ATP-binding protein [Halosquirtibacter laminarini]|uniref:ABC transporter ATP-binding protein n=1 Tax=Halosquirtibacter laminarini TaxID=3374600 RepID=A0AC61NRB4_9BACT|nr:ABC transporter ATP-binding protein [Prolixibacteraceae bacterium]